MLLRARVWCLQMHRRELLSGSFGPLQGPFTTLTSLAAFKARVPAHQSIAQDAGEEQASRSSAPAPAREEQSSAAGLQGKSEHSAAQINHTSLAAPPGSADRHEAGNAQSAKQSEAGHDRQQSRSASNTDKNSGAVGQHEQSDVSRLWEDPANVDAVHAALEAFLQQSGLSKHMRIEHTEVGTSRAYAH